MDEDVSFGEWLRRRRKALDLTQEDLARRVSYSVSGIRKVEADERRPSREMAERLAEQLEIPSEQRARFIRAARREFGRDALSLPGRSVELERARSACLRHNLPAQLTSFVGRAQEISEVTQLLAYGPAPAGRQRDHRSRLVTLTGPPGTGKTRLALEVAGELVDAFADGLAFADLGSVDDPAFVVPTIARSLGVEDRGGQPLLARLKDYLHQRHLLLVVDNFEQVLPAAANVTELLAACPRLVALVTSRARLQLRGEHEVAVEPLATPDELCLQLRGAALVSALTRLDAVRLFVERARAVQRDFALTVDNAAAVAEICRRLDGLPLAIELAASRVRMFPPRAMLARLDRRLPLLTAGPRDAPVRQQTLRDAIAWSYGLLDDAERSLLRRLAVFSGGWTLDAVEAVGRGSGQGTSDAAPPLADTLEPLVSQSLVRRGPEVAGSPRFEMLATVREYAGEQLLASGEAAVCQRRHAAYFVALAETAQPRFAGSGREEWRARLEADHDNLRAVLGWSLGPEADVQDGLRLAGALGSFWMQGGYWREGRSWYAAVLSHPAGRGPTLDRARALNEAASLAFVSGDLETARSLAEEALSLGQNLADPGVQARALSLVGTVAGGQSDYSSACAIFARSVASYREAGDHWGVAHALYGLGSASTLRGDFPAALASHQESLALYRELGDPWGIGLTVGSLGELAYYQGDVARARALSQESLELRRQMGDRRAIAVELNRLGDIARSQGDLGGAQALYEECLALSREVGRPRDVARALCHLGYLTQMQQSNERSRTYLCESLALNQKLGEKRLLGLVLVGLARLAVENGQPRRAARLLGAAETQHHRSEALLGPADRSFRDLTAEVTRARLDEDAFAAACAEGQAMTTEQATAHALSEEDCR